MERRRAGHRDFDTGLATAADAASVGSGRDYGRDDDDFDFG